MYPAFSRITRLMIVLVVLFTTLIASTKINFVKAQETATLLEDSFEDNTNNWEMAFNPKNVDMNFEDGEMAFTINEGGDQDWTVATPDKTFPQDVDVSTDIKVSGAASDARWYAGLILRSSLRKDSDDAKVEYYHFEISSTGDWGVAKKQDPKNIGKNEKAYVFVKQGKLTKFDPEDTHTLAVSAQGDEFVFEVDRKKLGTFKDEIGNEAKYLGVVAGREKDDSSDSVTISFDNFLVQGEDTGNSGGNDNSVESGGILLKDNFKDNSNEWSLKKNDQSSVTLEDDTLTMEIFEGTKDGWLRGVVPNKVMPDDVDVSVKATVDDSGSKGSWEYGIGVRYAEVGDSYTYYFFALNSSDEWVFSSYDGKKSHVIERGKLKDFDPTSSNKLNMIATGSKFEFFVNNKKVGDAEDDSLEQQKNYYVMLVAVADDENSSIRVNYNNLLVLKP